MQYKIPDKKNALSLIEAAERDMSFTLKLEISEESAPTIIRNIYESFRMLGEAILISKGIRSEDHITPIMELSELDINTKRPIKVIDNLRKMRHNINYYGYRPRIEEALYAREIALDLFDIIKEYLKNTINSTK